MAAIRFKGLRFHPINQILAKVSKSTGQIGPSEYVNFSKVYCFLILCCAKTIYGAVNLLFWSRGAKKFKNITGVATYDITTYEVYPPKLKVLEQKTKMKNILQNLSKSKESLKMDNSGHLQCVQFFKRV